MNLYESQYKRLQMFKEALVYEIKEGDKWDLEILLNYRVKLAQTLY
jgi:hypothetical protein